jgi:S1-C subfamily serine protease
MSNNDYSPPMHSSAFPPPGRTRTPLLVGILIGLLAGWALVSLVRNRSGTVQSRPRTVTARGDLAEDEKSTIALFQQASPSVVYITSISRRTDFLGINVFDVPQGTGSGFIWDDAGHIVTNFHVIQDANAVEVTLSDRSSYPAKLVGREPSKDLAVLRIFAPAEKLRPLPVGASNDLLVGQKVFAIGNPFGWDYSLTTGVVSALGRTIPSFDNRTIDGVIQTDAAINPGNSGGPLLDSAGRLIGVTTQIYSPSGASAGIGFAVPVDTVNKVVPQLIEHGKVVRPYMGVQLMDDGIVRRVGLRGSMLQSVTQGGPAEKAGLRGTRRSASGQIVLGDLIVKVDDRSVTSNDDLLSALERHKIGDMVSIAFVRDDEQREVKLTLESPP